MKNRKIRTNDVLFEKEGLVLPKSYEVKSSVVDEDDSDEWCECSPEGMQASRT